MIAALFIACNAIACSAPTGAPVGPPCRIAVVSFRAVDSEEITAEIAGPLVPNILRVDPVTAWLFLRSWSHSDAVLDQHSVLYPNGWMSERAAFLLFNLRANIGICDCSGAAMRNNGSPASMSDLTAQFQDYPYVRIGGLYYYLDRVLCPPQRTRSACVFAASELIQIGSTQRSDMPNGIFSPIVDVDQFLKNGGFEESLLSATDQTRYLAAWIIRAQACTATMRWAASEVGELGAAACARFVVSGTDADWSDVLKYCALIKIQTID